MVGFQSSGSPAASVERGRGRPRLTGPPAAPAARGLPAKALKPRPLLSAPRLPSPESQARSPATSTPSASSPKSRASLPSGSPDGGAQPGEAVREPVWAAAALAGHPLPASPPPSWQSFTTPRASPRHEAQDPGRAGMSRARASGRGLWLGREPGGGGAARTPEPGTEGSGARHQCGQGQGKALVGPRTEGQGPGPRDRAAGRGSATLEHREPRVGHRCDSQGPPQLCPLRSGCGLLG